MSRPFLLIFIWILMMCYCINASSQSSYTWAQFVEDYTIYQHDLDEESESLSTDESYEAIPFVGLYHYEEIAENPIDINHAERSELEELLFLSDEQIDSLLSKRQRYMGGFRSLGELMSVRQLSYRDRAWLSLFVKFVPLTNDSLDVQVRNSSLRTKKISITPQLNTKDSQSKKWYSGSHELTAKFDIPLYERAGFYDYDDSNYVSKRFLGQRFGHTMRYRYNWNQRIRYGFTLQQDIGERFGTYGSRPWDYQSFYLYYRSDLEQYEFRTATSKKYGQSRRHSVSRYEFTAGDYHLSIGQGLIIGTSIWGAQTGYFNGLRSESVHFRPNTGVDESKYLRGAVATLRLGKRAEWSFTAFGSWRLLDGTVKGMSAKNDYVAESNDTITAWKTDGMHRTLQEINKRNVAQQYIIGGRVSYNNSWLNLGFNGLSSLYNVVFDPPLRTYNRYYLRGNSASAFSMDYSIIRRRWAIKGELAFDQKLSCASSVVLYTNPLPALKLFVQERSISYAFVSPYGGTIVSNSRIQNEHGILVGAKFSGIRRVEVLGFFDASLHRKPVYLADTLSHRLSAKVQIDYRSNPRWLHSLHYRLKGREQNVTGYKDIPDYNDVLLSWRMSQRMHWQSSWSGLGVSCSFGADLSNFTSQATVYDKKTDTLDGPNSAWGGLIFIRSTSKPLPFLKFSIGLASFLTENYNARCYVYLPQLRGGMTASFYGKGVAGNANIEYTVYRKFVVAACFSSAKYFDRTEISSGINKIPSSFKNDISLELRWRL